MSWHAELVERLRVRAENWRDTHGETAPAAIDLWDRDSEACRMEAHSNVRAALSDGARAARLGLAFVAVVSDLAYEIDWQDQFSFWPLLNKRLDVRAFDLSESARREECANAFRAAAREFGLLTPRGQFADSFPLMSLPICHAVLPRCAHRRVVELLLDAVPSDALAALARHQGAPQYVVDLLEHEDLRARLARLRTDDDTADVGVLHRIRADIVAERIARDVLERARRSQWDARDRRRVPLRLSMQLGPPVNIAVEFGPIDDVEKLSEAFARTVSEFASVSFVVSVPGLPSRTFEGGYLVNARGRAIVVPITLPASDGEFQIQAQLSPVPTESDVDASIGPPLRITSGALFRKGATSFYYPRRDSRVHRGEAVAVLVTASAGVPNGFGDPSPIAGTPWSVAYGEPDATTATALGLTVAEYTRIYPAFNPPCAASALTCEYDSTDTACFWVEGLDPHLRVVLVRGAESKVLQTSAVGKLALVRVEPQDLQQPATVAVLDGNGDEVASIAISPHHDARRVEPIVATLNPPGSTLEQLNEGVCWVEAWTTDDSPIVVRIEGTGGAAAEVELVLDQYADHERAVEAFSALIARMEASFAGAIMDQAPLRLSAARTDDRLRARNFAAVRAASIGALARVDGDEAVIGDGVENTSILVVHTDTLHLATSALGPLQKLTVECAEGLYMFGRAEETSAIVWASSAGALPGPAVPFGVERSLLRARTLVEALRELDRCSLGPSRSLARAELLRTALIVQHERALVRVLCGTAWLNEEAATRELGFRQTTHRLAPLAGFNLGAVDELVSSFETVQRGVIPMPGVAKAKARKPMGAHELLVEFLEETNEEVEDIEERSANLLLLFFRRAAAPRARDAEILAWAFENPRAARFVRLVDLVTKRALREGASERDANAG